MMFVSGMMGPYMSPIPANASIAMLFSFGVAVTVTPWLLLRIAGRHAAAIEHGEGHTHDIGALGRLYTKIATPLLSGRRRSQVFLVAVGLATLAVCALFATKDVRVKLLPFDNKSEIQVVLDMPQGTALEETERTLTAAAERLKNLPELTTIQAYAGAAAPFNFNGLVRHYYLRDEPQQGDLAVNLVDKSERKRASHAIALDIRHRLADLPLPTGTALKVVEVPPGPPVLSTVLAEVYGPDPESRRAMAAKVRQGVQGGRFRRRRRRQLPQAGRAPAPLDRPAGAGIPRRRGAGGLRHDRRPARRRADRLFAARRRPQADRHLRRPAPLGAHARRAPPVDAAAGRRHAFARAPTSSSATSSS